MKFMVDNNDNTTKYFKRVIDKYMDACNQRVAHLNSNMYVYTKFERECDRQMDICFSAFEGAEVVFEDGTTFTIINPADVMHIGIQSRK